MLILLLPVLIPYFHSFGLGQTQVYLLQSVFALTSVIFEIPSGYISDLFSRKHTLIFGYFIWFIGHLVMAYADSFNILIVSEILMGLGMSFISGTDLALLYDTQNELKMEKKNLMGNVILSTRIGETIGAIAGGFLAVISLKLTAKLSAYIMILPLILCFFLKEPKRNKAAIKNPFTNLKIIFNSFRTTPLLKLIFINSSFFSISTLLAVWVFQDQWTRTNLPLAYFGLLWALINISTGVLSYFMPRIEDKWGPLYLILIMTTLAPLSYFLLGFFSTSLIVAIIVPFLFQIIRSINHTMMKHSFNTRLPEEFRATVNSLEGFVTRGMYFILGPLLGYSTDKMGTSFTYMGVSVLFLIGSIILTIPLIRKIKES